MNKSYLIAIGLIAALVLWMLSGVIGSATDGVSALQAESPRASEPMAVQVRIQPSEPVVREIVIQGQTEPNRTVTLRAETTGQVAELVAQRGQRVKAGDVILRIRMDDREARLRQAQALVRQRERDHEAINKLGQTGHQAQTRVNQALAELEAARAELERVKLDIANTTVRAPFDGILNERQVEIGTVLAPNDALATLVDDSPLVVSGQVSQQAIGRLRLGQTVRVRLVNGAPTEGTIRYISALGDTTTRTFRIEVEVPNPEGTWVAGISSELRIPVETVITHFLSPALLTLDAGGILGIKTVAANNRVEFHPVEIVRASADGVWVAGLPEQARLITVGQGFVQIGERVRTTPEISLEQGQAALATVSGVATEHTH